MPFGYAFDPNSNFPFPSPIAPAPGPSLLDDNESRFLDSFFDGVNNSDPNFDFFTNAADGAELGLGWNEVPPTFMGTTTSFGQQPQIVSQQGLPEMNFNGLNSQMNNPASIPPSSSADLLAAATILQNTPNGRSQSLSNEALFRGQELSIPPTNGQVRPQSISHYPLPRSNRVNREPHATEDPATGLRVTYYADMVFGRQVAESSRPRQLNQTHSKADIKWGSDTSFNTPDGFIPPITQRKEMAKIDFPFQIMEENFIESPSSAENSRPSSPTQRAKPAKPPSPKKRRFTSHINYSDDEDRLPTKRRKSKFQDEDDDDDSPASAGAKTKRRKSTKDSTASELNPKRRKSTGAAAAKAARENLTEDQKRENHIKSEQKRRTLIREGFEDLGELVPGLRGGGFSKSAVLIMSADWLEELIQGNEVLRQRLAQLQLR